ncbi:hypothetical protein L0P88_17925 [Muricauda sp. SCSIO 64092]|uniref:hypothetical protein n=1 Tax=Allomuricauda sp. SCSIO 64092 TaxID=2908842 RepID=UPI001FF63B98|nr:hypothetical protein [Muricauda sp. SCSIO 64092]UOY05806.1 hypothetical protein L0P88_17925 [Muricauda sp. SCSIO 64092]
MYKSTILLLVLTPLLTFGQKIKSKKNPIAWSYYIVPENPLGPDIKTIELNQDLRGLTSIEFNQWKKSLPANQRNIYSGDEEYNRLLTKWSFANRDSTRRWVKRSFNFVNYQVVDSDADLQIELSNDGIRLINIRENIDFQNNQSIVGELDISLLLSVKKADQLVYEKSINYFFNEEGPNYIKLDDIPAKKLKEVLEDKDKSKDRKVRSIQRLIPDNNEPLIKKELIKQARETFDANFFGNKISFPGAVYTFKNKEYSEFNEVAEKVYAEIKSLYALSKKKRKSFEEVRPTLESAMTF